MQKHTFFILFVAVLMSSAAIAGSPNQAIGIVKNVAGNVFISNSQGNIKAVQNMKISLGDSIHTGLSSSVGLIFEDDTVVSLGANSEIVIEGFLFKPAQKELSFVARMIKGTFSFITGQIAKLAPKKVQLETPDATLGVRGTKILVEIE